MKTAILCGLLITSATGCGMMIGTPDYWVQYNETVRRAGMVQMMTKEHITNTDRAQLDAMINPRQGR